MLKEYTILSLLAATGIILYILFIVPNEKRLQAILAFLFYQAFSWVNDFIQTQLRLVEFPVREFPKATDILFTTAYFLYPVVFALYFIYKSDRFSKTFQMALWVSVLTLVDSLLERYTELISYLHLTWYLAWVSFFLLFYLTDRCMQWFFKDPKAFRTVWEEQS